MEHDPRITSYFSCQQCGSCTSSCPSTYAFFHDRAFQREYNPMRLVGLLRLRGTLPEDEPLDKCFHCYSCKSVCRTGNSVSDLVKVLRERRGAREGPLRRSLYEKGLCITPELFSSLGMEDWRGFRRILGEMPRIRREMGLPGLHRQLPEEGLQQVRRIVEESSRRTLSAGVDRPRLKKNPFPRGGIYLFKSCAMDTHYPGATLSMKYVLEEMGLKYLDDEAQSSCGGFGYYADEVPLSTVLALNARNFALAEASGFPNVAAVCVTSYGILTECLELLEGGLGEEVNGVLREVGLRYRGGVRVYHLSEILHAFRGEMRSKVRFDLSGLRVATHMGCHYTKMFPEYAFPNLLDDLVRVVGAEPVDYAEKSLCCGMGFRLTLENRELVRRVALRKLRSARDAGARAVIYACPGCQMTLDRNQRKLEEETGEEFGLVHLNYAQLLALAMGADPYRVVGIQTHSCSPLPLLEELGIT